MKTRMNVKSLELDSNVDIGVELGNIIDLRGKFTEKQENEKSKMVENTEIKSLSQYKKRNIVVTYMEKIVKRIIDICAGIVGAIVLVPLILFVYISNKLAKDDGPIFYTQDRIGKNGKVFKMLKFRTMVIGADEKLATYLKENEDARREYEVYKKLKHDPRITRNGKFLRKTSLDEMPQLLHLITRKNVASWTTTILN